MKDGVNYLLPSLVIDGMSCTQSQIFMSPGIFSQERWKIMPHMWHIFFFNSRAKSKIHGPNKYH